MFQQPSFPNFVRRRNQPQEQEAQNPDFPEEYYRKWRSYNSVHGIDSHNTGRPLLTYSCYIEYFVLDRMHSKVYHPESLVEYDQYCDDRDLRKSEDEEAKNGKAKPKRKPKDYRIFKELDPEQKHLYRADLSSVVYFYRTVIEDKTELDLEQICTVMQILHQAEWQELPSNSQLAQQLEQVMEKISPKDTPSTGAKIFCAADIPLFEGKRQVDVFSGYLVRVGSKSFAVKQSAKVYHLLQSIYEFAQVTQ